MSVREIEDLPWPTNKPWMPWLREDGLTDGDKLLISIAPEMAGRIIAWCRTSDHDPWDCSRQECPYCDLLDISNKLRRIGAES